MIKAQEHTHAIFMYAEEQTVVGLEIEKLNGEESHRDLRSTLTLVAANKKSKLSEQLKLRKSNLSSVLSF